MTYTIRNLHQPSFDRFDDFNPLVTFCKAAQKETDNPAIENVRYDDWAANRSSLLYAVSQGRFDDPVGTFQTVIHNDRVVSVAGAYISDFDPNAVMVGCRAWTLPEHRTRFLIGDLILPEQLDWALAHGADIAMFSFVPYNAWLAKMILRASAGRALRPGQQNSSAYMGWVAHPTLCVVKNVNQIILYKQLGIETRVPDLEKIDTKLHNDLD